VVVRSNALDIYGRLSSHILAFHRQWAGESRPPSIAPHTFVTNVFWNCLLDAGPNESSVGTFVQLFCFQIAGSIADVNDMNTFDGRPYMEETELKIQ
jgi:hypothetical protein